MKKTVQDLCEEFKVGRDDIADATGHGRNAKPITAAIERFVRPTLEVQQEIASYFKLEIDDIDWDPIPLSEISERFTELPIVASKDWWRFNGCPKTREGGLRGRTDTDYFFFDCPGCGGKIHPKLGGISSGLHLAHFGYLPYHTLGFNYKCEECGLVSGFKMFVQQDL